jgi:predicted PurR-regulated permease PerM
MYVLNLTGRMFNRFIFGKALDSLIIGILCYVIVSLMGLPYTALIAVVIGFTNMIPVFGPFLGAIPCIFILFIINPLQALEFTVFILILQQIDGNIIGPYILGDSLGLPNVWVIFAIIAGGALFGIPGMFIGVPIFAVIYILLRGFINKQLERKHLDTEKL